MIVRRYVDIQEYNYALVNIFGSENPVAGGIFR